MSVLLLQLTGPLQSWGEQSRFVQRETNHFPTKSGILGLIAAAQGRRRTDPLEDLTQLRLGVRIDQPGRLIRDFHTARSPITGKSFPLSHRYYLGDAVFLAGIEGDHELLNGIADAIRNPAFPLYLGRRSCPPSRPLVIEDVNDVGLSDALGHDWIASPWHQKKTRSERVTLEIFRDALNTDEVGDQFRDVPISFSQEERQYGWRTVVRETVEVNNLCYVTRESASDGRGDHDFMAALGG